MADRVVDPDDELPASSLRESGLGGGVSPNSGSDTSLSPSRLLKILGRLGEPEVILLVSMSYWTGCAGKLTNRVCPPTEPAVILAALSPCPALLRFKVVGLLERLMATAWPPPIEPEVVAVPLMLLLAMKTDPCCVDTGSTLPTVVVMVTTLGCGHTRATGIA